MGHTKETKGKALVQTLTIHAKRTESLILIVLKPLGLVRLGKAKAVLVH